jgi:FtsZ-binding cell division protein ZapB
MPENPPKTTVSDAVHIVVAALLIVLAAFAVSSCATAQHVAPRFVAPSTAPIAKAQVAISKRQVETAQHIQKAEEIVRTLTIRLPEDKIKIDALTTELMDAQTSNDQLRTENDSLKGANDSLTAQIGTQTAQANQLSDNYNKAQLQIISLEASRHKYVKAAWLFGGILGLEVLVAAGFMALKFGFF